jgi:hypothetical protein
MVQRSSPCGHISWNGPRAWIDQVRFHTIEGNALAFETASKKSPIDRREGLISMELPALMDGLRLRRVYSGHRGRNGLANTLRPSFLLPQDAHDMRAEGETSALILSMAHANLGALSGCVPWAATKMDETES